MGARERNDRAQREPRCFSHGQGVSNGEHVGLGARTPALCAERGGMRVWCGSGVGKEGSARACGVREGGGSSLDPRPLCPRPAPSSFLSRSLRRRQDVFLPPKSPDNVLIKNTYQTESNLMPQKTRTHARTPLPPPPRPRLPCNPPSTASCPSPCVASLSLLSLPHSHKRARTCDAAMCLHVPACARAAQAHTTPPPPRPRPPGRPPPPRPPPPRPPRRAAAASPAAKAAGSAASAAATRWRPCREERRPVAAATEPLRPAPALPPPPPPPPPAAARPTAAARAATWAGAPTASARCST